MPTETDANFWKLLLRLPQDHPLRLHAAAVLADPQTPTSDPEPVLHAALSRGIHWRTERRVAWWLIAHVAWSGEQRLLISETLSRTAARAMYARKPANTLLRWFRRAMSFSLLSVLIFPYDYLHTWGDLSSWLLQATSQTVLLSFLSLPFSYRLDDFNTRRLEPVVAALGKFGHAADLATLVAASLHPSLYPSARRAIVEITARLSAEDYGTLPLQDIPTICRLFRRLSTYVVLTILEAFILIGDAQAVPAVEKLAQEAPSALVRERAATLLPLLKKRARESQDPALLLRAGDAPSEDGKTLLRVAREASGTEPALLLRPTTATNGGESWKRGTVEEK